ncbi:MAG: hypothetical protein HQK98_06980 [Nitrospirae bacterium]|nr:hypothetical protein [Nitrospirota bacterium]
MKRIILHTDVYGSSFYIEHKISEYELIEYLFDGMYYPERFNAEKVQERLFDELRIKKSIDVINKLWTSYCNTRQRSEVIQCTVSPHKRLCEMTREV